MLILLLLAALSCPIWGEVYRLPKTIKPIRYHLTLEPDLPTTQFADEVNYTGSVMIELQALENTNIITLHRSSYYKIDKSSVVVEDSNNNTFQVTFIKEDSETSSIALRETLQAGQDYKLTIGSFKGELTFEGEGFFYADYYDKNRKFKAIAATHFEPAGARKAFPCFDEPALKAKFIISLIRKEGFSSVSNEKIDFTTDLGGGRFKDTFRETPLMSTYIVAFAVTDFEYSETVGRHRITARDVVIEQGYYKFALDIAVKGLKALEEYTGIDFVLNKVDYIAIPGYYFKEWAMENWGLIVFKEEQMILTDNLSASHEKTIATVMAHEFAHQWFGNLVTPAWWDYIWLGESFAAYFQHHAADLVEPSWRLKEQFVVDVVQESFRKESSESCNKYEGAFPLTVKIEQTGTYPPFHIMYEKGSTIIRMMSYFLGQETFRKGLQKYLGANKFGNTVPSDLYKALQEAVDEDKVDLGGFTVAEVVGSWEHNKGFPILKVTRDYQNGRVTFEQINKFDAKAPNWIIPVNYVFSEDKAANFSDTTPDFWLSNKSHTINNVPTEGWLVVNKQQTGYYIVAYDEENWERIIEALKSVHYTKIDPVSRAQLINSVFYLAYHDMLPWNRALQLGEYLIREEDYIPIFSFYKTITNYVKLSYWSSNRDEFVTFRNYSLTNEVFARNETVYEATVYKEYIMTLVGRFARTLGKRDNNGESFLDRLHRSYIRNLNVYMWN